MIFERENATNTVSNSNITYNLFPNPENEMDGSESSSDSQTKGASSSQTSVASGIIFMFVNVVSIM